MKRTSYLLFPLCFILFAGCSHDQHSNQPQSPYTGQETREIKGLTTQEVEEYLTGMGMGLSKVAELNQYPGPGHVLELANQLELSDQQQELTQALFNQMKKEAIDIGKSYIEKEEELNRLFESNEVTSSKVDSLLVEIGKLKGTLRSVHIKAHIEMKEILTFEQVKKYDRLRGYENGASSHTHQNNS